MTNQGLAPQVRHGAWIAHEARLSDPGGVACWFELTGRL